MKIILAILVMLITVTPLSAGGLPARQQIYRIDAGRVFVNQCGTVQHVRWPHWSDPFRHYGFTFVVTARGGGRLIATVQKTTVTVDVPYDNVSRPYTMVVRHEQIPPELAFISLRSERDQCATGELSITGLDVWVENVPLPYR